MKVSRSGLFFVSFEILGVVNRCLTWCSNLLSVLLRCDTRPYEWGIQWDSNSLVKIGQSSLLTFTSPYVLSLLHRYITFLHLVYSSLSSSWKCPWCNGYRRRKWTRRHESKSLTTMIAFHIALIPLGKVWIQLFSLQLWVNSRAD